MARLPNGIMGGFSGKVGTVVGYSRYGRDFMRSRPKPITKKPTQAQLENREAFAQTQFWLKPITEFVRVGFKNYSDKQHGFGSAKSYLYKHALRGTYPDYRIDPAKALVSWGNLPEANEPEVVYEPDEQTLVFSWKPLADPGKVYDNDHVMLLAYCTELETAALTTCGVRRKAGTDHIRLPGRYRGLEIDVFIAFINEERTECSASRYLGKIRVD